MEHSLPIITVASGWSRAIFPGIRAMYDDLFRVLDQSRCRGIRKSASGPTIRPTRSKVRSDTRGSRVNGNVSSRHTLGAEVEY